MNPHLTLMRQVPHLMDWLNRRQKHQRLIEVIYVNSLGRKSAQLPRLRALLESCIRRNWSFAAARIRRRIQLLVRDIEIDAGSLAGQFSRPCSADLSADFVVDELRQLSDEFGDVRIDRSVASITVTTEPITLEGIALGRFDITLHVNDMEMTDPSRCLRIIALEPNPAQCAEDVTHPHVQNEHLCTGDASIPMRLAIQDGRICDLFLLVRSVLTTYNAESPFARLSQWFGRPCADCDETLEDEDSHYCEGCDRDYCESCMSWCRRCDLSRCGSCLGTCSVCSDPCCGGCLSNCSDCALACCEECMTDGCCESCLEKRKEETDETKPQSNCGQPDPAAPVAA